MLSPNAARKGPLGAAVQQAAFRLEPRAPSFLGSTRTLPTGAAPARPAGRGVPVFAGSCPANSRGVCRHVLDIGGSRSGNRAPTSTCRSPAGRRQVPAAPGATSGGVSRAARPPPLSRWAQPVSPGPSLALCTALGRPPAPLLPSPCAPRPSPRGQAGPGAERALHKPNTTRSPFPGSRPPRKEHTPRCPLGPDRASGVRLPGTRGSELLPASQVASRPPHSPGEAADGGAAGAEGRLRGREELRGQRRVGAAGLGSGTPAPVHLSPLEAEPDIPTGWARSRPRAQQAPRFEAWVSGATARASRDSRTQGPGLEARETQRPPSRCYGPALFTNLRLTAARPSPSLRRARPSGKPSPSPAERRSCWAR